MRIVIDSREQRPYEFQTSTQKGTLLTGDYSLHVYWRGGDTVSECEGAPWESLGDLNIDNPVDAVLYVDKTARFHQIKWGTDGASEPFSINEIRLRYQDAGRY